MDEHQPLAQEHDTEALDTEQPQQPNQLGFKDEYIKLNDKVQGIELEVHSTELNAVALANVALATHDILLKRRTNSTSRSPTGV